MSARETLEHNAVVTDAQLEAGEFRIGALVHISTATHAFRGYLLAVSPSHYYLDPSKPWSIVDAAGQGDDVGLSGYCRAPTTPRRADEISGPHGKVGVPRLRIARAAECWAIEWAGE